MTAPAAAPPAGEAAPATRGGDTFADAFGQRLVAESILDVGSCDRARRAAVKTGERFDHVLTKLGLVPDAVLLEALARHLGIAVATARDLPAAPVMPDAIRLPFIRSRQILPLAADAGQLTIAIVDPFDDEPVRALAYWTGREVSTRLMPASEFAGAVQSLYGER